MANRLVKPTPEQLVTDLRRHVGHFTEDPYFRLGNADSVHGVLFGNLANLGAVAVKPFGTNGLGRAKGEHDNLKRAAEAGFEALEPLAVAKGGLAAYLVTRRRNGLRHLGQINWGINIASPELNGIARPTLVTAASTLADWHNKGIFNGDAQAKNLAYDKKTGESVYIDAERMHFNPSGSKSVDLGNKDLSLLGVSALWRGLLHDKSPSYRAGFLGDSLLDPYMDGITYPTHGTTAEDRQRVIQQEWVRGMERNQPPDWLIGAGQVTTTPAPVAPLTRTT